MKSKRKPKTAEEILIEQNIKNATDALRKLENFLRKENITINIDDVFNKLSDFNLEAINTLSKEDRKQLKQTKNDGRLNTHKILNTLIKKNKAPQNTKIDENILLNFNDAIKYYQDSAKFYFKERFAIEEYEENEHGENIEKLNVESKPIILTNVPTTKKEFIEIICKKEKIDMGNNEKEQQEFIDRPGLILKKPGAIKEELTTKLIEYITMRRKEFWKVLGIGMDEKIAAAYDLELAIHGTKQLMPRQIEVLTEGRLGNMLKSWVKQNAPYVENILPRNLTAKINNDIKIDEENAKHKETKEKQLTKTGLYIYRR